MKRNSLHFWKESLYLLAAALAAALLVILMACAAQAPASVPQSECAPACPTEPLAQPPPEPPVVPPTRPSPSETVPRITTAELQQKLESKADILIVDNRHKEEYDVDHIKGAVSVPLSVIVAGEWTLPLDKELIFYCS